MNQKSQLKSLIEDLKRTFYTYIGHIAPKWVANRRYKGKFGRNINWDNPVEFNEKIRWLQFYTDTSKWSLLADKYRVRAYLEKKGYGDMLVKLYGVWPDAAAIDFSQLPDSFVMKTNHGYGEVVVVREKGRVSEEKLRMKMEKYRKTPFGYASAELHYLSIKPVIMAEELLDNDLNLSSSIVDYKFYCFKGEPVCCGVFYDRSTAKNGSFYDMDWNRRDDWRSSKLDSKPQKEIPKPVTFEQMKRACRKLAAEFPFVRMDFYESHHRLYFGEFTFTPAALSGGSLSDSALQLFSEKLQIKKNIGYDGQ